MSDLSQLILFGAYEQAEREARRRLERNPDDMEAIIHMGTLEGLAGRPLASLAWSRQVLQSDPTHFVALNNTANSLKNLGYAKESIKYYSQAVTQSPQQGVIRSNLLMSYQYLDIPPAATRKVHELYGQAWEQPQAPPRPKPYKNKTMKVGFLSSEVKGHACMYFLIRLFTELPCNVTVYSATGRTDDVSEWIADHVKVKDILRLRDQEAAEMIRKDRIDILIDTTGHTAANRLGIFSWHPAPVTAHYLGYPCTLGLKDIDYWIGGPSDVGHDDHFTETLICLPTSRWCYYAIDPAPNALPPRNKWFLCFNNPSKFSEKTIRMFDAVLDANPDAKLFLKYRHFQEADVVEDFLTRFARSDRIVTEKKLPNFLTHMDKYNDGVIALDTYPYNGTTTTVESLAMGRPVITLEGGSHRSHTTAEILRTAGLGQWVAKTEGEYVEIATRWFKWEPDHKIIAHQFQTGPLYNHDRFVREFHTLLQEIKK